MKVFKVVLKRVYLSWQYTVVKAESDEQALEFANKKEDYVAWKDEEDRTWPEFEYTEVAEANEIGGPHMWGEVPSKEEIANAVTAK